MFRQKIKIERLILSIVLVLIVADTVPHPALHQGILLTFFSKGADMTQHLTSSDSASQN